MIFSGDVYLSVSRMALAAGLLRSSGCSRVLLPHLLLFLHHRCPLVSHSRVRTTSSYSFSEPLPFIAFFAEAFRVGPPRRPKNKPQSWGGQKGHTPAFFETYSIFPAVGQRRLPPLCSEFHASLLFSPCQSPVSSTLSSFGSLTSRPLPQPSGFSDGNKFLSTLVLSTKAVHFPLLDAYTSAPGHASGFASVPLPKAQLLSSKNNCSLRGSMISLREWGIRSLDTSQRGSVPVVSSLFGQVSSSPSYLCPGPAERSVPVSEDIASFHPSSVRTMSSSTRLPSGGAGLTGRKKPISRTCSLPARQSSRVVYYSEGQATGLVPTCTAEASAEGTVTPTRTDGVVVSHLDRGAVSSRSDEDAVLQDPEDTRTWLDVERFKKEIENSRRSMEADSEAKGSTSQSGTRPATPLSSRGSYESSFDCRSGMDAPSSMDHSQEWTVRVMTFNLLAESLTDYRYRSLDQDIVRWASRAKVIEKEILRHRPALCCLQELDATHYRQRLRPYFHALGYDSVYKQKTNGREDGVGTFWLRDRFELLEQHEIEFNQLSKSLLDKPQVGLVLLLRERLFPLPNAASAVSEGQTSALVMRAREAGDTSVGRRRRGGSASIPNTNPSTCVSPKRRCVDRSGQTTRNPESPAYGEREINGEGKQSAKSCGRMVVVANTHLLFNSRRGDLKLAQLLLLLRSVCELRSKALSILKAGGTCQVPSDGSVPSKETAVTQSSSKRLSTSTEPSKDASTAGSASGAPETCGGELVDEAAENLLDTFLCGDFNFTPHSPLYQLMLRGTFDFSGVDYRKLSGQFLMEKRTYGIDIDGYHGRGSTVVSTPSESRRITSAEGTQHYARSSCCRNELQHSHSMPPGPTAVAASRSEGRLQKHRSEAAFNTEKPGSSSSSWTCTVERWDTATPHGDTEANEARLIRSSSDVAAERHEFWELNNAAKDGFLASVITLPLKFKSAYALPRLLTGSSFRIQTGQLVV
ncbi:endonuclease exonuclease phosphatase family [Cystoisospora suis]|uniref:Endonuclease exonuclease phosphatase family n=1 Tax=Cystoisospora suis TaxID=483139 RepID=A0A2C6KUS7_9APIC|nr:endonuclease exonuclease phosphatase family [Cystoisospora suis]